MSVQFPLNFFKSKAIDQFGQYEWKVDGNRNRNATIVMKSLSLLFSIALLLTGCAAMAHPSRSDVVSKRYGRADLAELFVSYARKTDLREMKAWKELLLDKTPIKTEGDLTTPIELRDLAYCVLEVHSGCSFAPWEDRRVTAIKEIVACQTSDGVARYHIPRLSDDEFLNVYNCVDFYIEGYEQGKKDSQHFHAQKGDRH